MRPTLWTILLCILVAATIGCDRNSGSNSQKAATPASLAKGKSITFEVDGKGVRYLYRTGYGGARSKLRLADVPVAYRGAVSVHVNGETDDAKAGEQAYLAALYDAKPGDKAKAYLHDQAFFKSSSRAGIDAAHAAVAIEKMAMERAEMAPGSDFRRHITTTMFVEDPKTGKVTAKHVRVKRSDKRKVDDDGSWKRYVDETWKKAFGNEADKEASAEEEVAQPAWRPVVMYSTPWCPACKTAKKWLHAHNVPYEHRDVSTSQSARSEMQRYCRQNGLQPTAVPTFRIGQDNQMMQGWHAGRFERLAKK